MKEQVDWLDLEKEEWEIIDGIYFPKDFKDNIKKLERDDIKVEVEVNRYGID